MHDELVLVLLLGVILLALGSLSMLVVRLSSPSLQGMGRFSASFAAGSVGAGLLLVRDAPFVSVLLSDIALLGSFVLLHVAVLQLFPERSRPVWPGLALVSIQVGVDALRLAGLVGPRVRVSVFGLLVAVQAATTAVILWRMSRGRVRVPAMYSVCVLAGFGLFNLTRSVLVASGWLAMHWREWLSFWAFVLYLAVAMGLAFGFFWMTTATLTAEAEHLASTDPLTRVFNRRVFLRWCEKELLRTQRSRIPFSVLMVDLDHFKRINDNFGHHRGDEVLVDAVERMQDSVRGIDVLCRWGGEEFAVLLPNAPIDATRIVAERIRENIQRMGVPLDRNPFEPSEAARLTVSIGAATYRDLDDNIEDMLMRADQALYRAKGAGRNRVLVGA